MRNKYPDGHWLLRRKGTDVYYFMQPAAEYGVDFKETTHKQAEKFRSPGGKIAGDWPQDSEWVHVPPKTNPNPKGTDGHSCN